MIIECYNDKCKKHSCHEGGEEPLCFEEKCQWEPIVPAGYTEEELEKDNPFNTWCNYH